MIVQYAIIAAASQEIEFDIQLPSGAWHRIQASKYDIAISEETLDLFLVDDRRRISYGWKDICGVQFKCRTRE